jgi:hypothetical protein
MSTLLGIARDDARTGWNGWRGRCRRSYSAKSVTLELHCPKPRQATVLNGTFQVDIDALMAGSASGPLSRVGPESLIKATSSHLEREHSKLHATPVATATARGRSACAYLAKALITSALSMSSVTSKTCGLTSIAACPQALGLLNRTKCDSAASPSYVGGTRGSALPLAPFSSTTEFSSSDASLAASIRCSAACAHASGSDALRCRTVGSTRCVCSLRMLHIVCCKLHAHSSHFKALQWL